MVYTVTFNPVADYVVHTDEISVGGVSSSKSEKIYFGGKGINVPMVLSELGEMFGVTPKRHGEIAEYAQKLKDMGARNVLVSMAGGATAFSDGLAEKAFIDELLKQL